MQWDRVDELRSKGRDWGDIARDPSVDFHPDPGAGDPGRALRALYHRSGRRGLRGPARAAATGRAAKEATARRWTLPRIGYVLVPLVGVWFLLALVAPSPVGLLVPAIPYLALALAGAAVLLLYALSRGTAGPRWSKVYRTGVITGIVGGLLVAGGIGLVATVALGCPYLPPSGSGTAEPDGWTEYHVGAWQDDGRPVVFFYGATWCPYCSASSWALWKALSEFGSVSGTSFGYSYGPPETIQYIPEVILASTSLSSSSASFQVSEYVYGSDGVLPGTANCYQSAYVSAYSGGGIPFYVVNGQAIHSGTLVDPESLSGWANGANGGYHTVAQAVAAENASSGSPWLAVDSATWWMMAWMAKASGDTVASLAAEYHWSPDDETQVSTDLAAIG